MEADCMKKMTIMVVFFCLVVSNGFSGGKQEYKGKNYFVSIFGGAFAVAYSVKENLSEYELVEAIYDNKLYFVGVIAPSNQDEILGRGYIQNGDKFLLHDDYPNVLATYIGPRKDIRNSFIASEGNCWGVGYAVYGGEIFIVELIINDDEYKIFENNLK
jgi:hypothetical protein